MREECINGVTYRLPDRQSDFQRQLYIHLIQWKWEHITREPGFVAHRGRKLPYDAVLPEEVRDELPMIHPAIRDALTEHEERFPFRRHNHFHHMASSQAANINLFLPILRSSRANEILGTLIPGFARLATRQLDHGYRIEFWDAGYGGKGVLGDKSATAGTDSDLAIAYYDGEGRLCLWLVEHKLTESEFTPCGGYTSKARKPNHDCSRGYSEILTNKDLCFHHEHMQRRYWEITEANQGMFPNYVEFEGCPFRGGMNQLWRNQLLALGVAADDRQPFQRAHFSVVKHPRNSALDATIADYRTLTGNQRGFSVFDSCEVVRAAETIGDPEILKWAAWYRSLYDL